MREIAFTISMDYPGWMISKNGLWKGGNRRWGMNDEAKRWKANLADAVQLTLLAAKAFDPKPPVHVEVSGTFLDQANAPDLHNLGELICDSVQEGSGVDDKYYTFETTAPRFAPRVPEILVSVRIHTGEGQP